MTNNKYLTTPLSTINFKPHSTRQEEKRAILKLCKRKLKDLQNKKSFSVKTVLIKNTLKVMENQWDSGLVSGESGDDGEDITQHSASYIESLLNEIDLDRRQQSGKPPSISVPISSYDEATAPKSTALYVIEEFHNCETFSHDRLVFQEDPGLFLGLSLDDSTMVRDQST